MVWNSIAGAVLPAPTLLRTNAANINNIHPIFHSLEEWSFQLQTFPQSFSFFLLSLPWTADLNPLPRTLSNHLHALIQGDLKIKEMFSILLLNLLGVLCSVWFLEHQLRELPFLV